MKKILMVIGVLFLLAAVGLAIFVATFDIDRYRPQVVQAIQSAVGKPVRIEKLALGFNGGVSLQVKGLAIEPMVQVESISAGLRLMPLLKRDLQIGSVTIVRPTLFVERRPDGTINLMELVPSKTSSSSGGSALSFLIGSIRVEEGTIHLKDAAQPRPLETTLEHVEATMRNVSLTRPMNLEAKGSLAGGTMTLGGTADHFLSQPKVHFHLALDKVNLESLLPGAGSGQPALRGRLAGSFEGDFEGIEQSQMVQSLAGTGEVSLTDGAIVNFNLLREAFAHFSILPGLVDNLLAQLPESYQQRLSAPDTVLKQCTFNLAAAGGTFALSDLHLDTDTFELTTSARANLQGTFAAQALLRIEPQMSAAIVGIVKELRYLSDDQGRIQFPVTIQGTGRQMTILPDVGYLTSHITANAAQQLVGDLLQKFLKKKNKD